MHNSGNPDWKNKRGGPGGKPPPQEKVKLAKYGFKFAKEFAELLRDKKIDQVDIFRATGLKPKYQRPYFEYAAAIGDAALRALELEDE